VTPPYEEAAEAEATDDVASEEAAEEQAAAAVLNPAGFGKKGKKVCFIPTQYVGSAAPEWVELDANVTITHALSVGVANYKNPLPKPEASADAAAASEYFGDSKVRNENGSHLFSFLAPL
jgi:hypothetical protein